MARPTRPLARAMSLGRDEDIGTLFGTRGLSLRLSLAQHDPKTAEAAVAAGSTPAPPHFDGQQRDHAGQQTTSHEGAPVPRETLPTPIVRASTIPIVPTATIPTVPAASSVPVVVPKRPTTAVPVPTVTRTTVSGDGPSVGASAPFQISGTKPPRVQPPTMPEPIQQERSLQDATSAVRPEASRLVASADIVSDAAMRSANQDVAVLIDCDAMHDDDDVCLAEDTTTSVADVTLQRYAI